MGIDRITFSQEDLNANGYFDVQGNDVSGTFKIITDNNNHYTVEGSLVWNDKSGNTVDSFGGLISDVGQSSQVLNSTKGDGRRLKNWPKASEKF